jgi:hypothetical protein
METVVEHEHVIPDELWRAWKQRTRRHDKAVARRITFFGLLIIIGLAAIFVFRVFAK